MASTSTIPASSILLTGGSGRLGTSVRGLLPDLLCPSSSVFNITDYPGMVSYIESLETAPQVIVHAAAFTRTHEAPTRPAEVLDKNIIGACNIVKLSHHLGCRLIYISTDYVFRGDRGNYREDDEVLPTNPYAWSKLGGECAVRLYPNSLIVRCTFGEEPFPFERAFSDLWTSKLGVSEMASRLVPILFSDVTGVIHIGSNRRTILDYAVSISNGKKISGMSTRDSNLHFPTDTSLDCSKYDKMFGGAQEGGPGK